MTTIPITHVTLYKHGVGYFERRARLSGQEVSLSLRVEEMNDVLKSLTAIDWGDGQVLGVEYPSPQSREELLAGCSIHLRDHRSLQDLLVSLRGRRVRLLLDQGEALSGALLGLDEAPEEEPLATALVSLLLDDSTVVQAAPLGRVRGVELLDDSAAGDLRFFLASSLTQEAHRQVTVRLTPGEHDLSLSYVAPAPSWRVSYRLVVEEGEEGKGGNGEERRALLLGWGIFDNRLEEDLKEISLSLVAGMPISFVYDLVTPVTPERPEVKDESRVAPGPVSFGAAMPPPAAPMMASLAMDESVEGAAMQRAAAPAKRGMSVQALDRTTTVAASGADLGELFEYTIATPVTVGRGQSAMVPIVSARLDCRKDLLYNGSKLARHPVATLRMSNDTGLTLERGPATVIDRGQYAGEAVLPFTAVEGELVAPYAVELAVKVAEESSNSREVHGLRISGYYLTVEEWDVRTRLYRLHNSSAKALTVLVEHPRTSLYELFATPAPQEQTAEHVRFAVATPARGEATLTVQERRLVSRHEEIRRQSAQTLQGFATRGLLDKQTHAQLSALLALWERLAAHERRLAEIEQERQKIYKGQEQARGNMGALGAAGKEGELRAGYVDKLRVSEQQLDGLAGEEKKLQAEIARLKEEIDTALKALT
ncbi:MAG TPA: hypothetical protein VL334_20200 [Anaerolineae bacterium]|nr:hypothetical protein [Anaerolineae bacterium]